MADIKCESGDIKNASLSLLEKEKLESLGKKRRRNCSKSYSFSSPDDRHLKKKQKTKSVNISPGKKDLLQYERDFEMRAYLKRFRSCKRSRSRSRSPHDNKLSAIEVGCVKKHFKTTFKKFSRKESHVNKNRRIPKNFYHKFPQTSVQRPASSSSNNDELFLPSETLNSDPPTETPSEFGYWTIVYTLFYY